MSPVPASPLDASWVARWCMADIMRVTLVKVTLADPTAKTYYWATTPALTPDGQTWQGILVRVDAVHAPGGYLSTGMDTCQSGFRVANVQLGSQTRGRTLGYELSARRWIGALASVYFFTPGYVPQPIFLNAVIDDYEPGPDTVYFNIVQRRTSNRDVIPRYAQRDTDPKAPDQAIGQPLPIIIGDGRWRPMRGDWNGANHDAGTQRWSIRGGMVPASPCLQTNQGAGGFVGSEKGEIVVAGHRITSILEAGNLGNLGFKAGGDVALYDVPSGDVAVADRRSSVYLDEANDYGYLAIPFATVEIQANPGDNARSLLDVKEYASARLDYDAGKKNIKYKLGSVPNLGTIVDVIVQCGYKTSGAGDVGQEIEWKNLGGGLGSTFFGNATGLPGSITPATMSASVGAPGVGNSLTVAAANLWDFSNIEVFLHFKAGVYTGVKIDFYFAQVVVKYRPKTNVVKLARVYPAQLKRRAAWREPGLGQATPALIRERAIEPAVLSLEGEWYANPQGWPDCEVITDPLDIAQRLQTAAQAVTTGGLFVGCGFRIRTGFNDKLYYSVTGAPSNPYTATIAGGVYSATSLCAAVKAAMDAGNHGKTFTWTYAARKFAVTISSGAGSLSNTSYTAPIAPVLGFQMGFTPTFNATADYVRDAEKFFCCRSALGDAWKWANVATTAEDLLGYDAVDDTAIGDSRADRAVTLPMFLTLTNCNVVFNDGSDHTVTIPMNDNFTGDYSLIQRAPDIAAFLLCGYGGQPMSSLERTVGGHGSFVDARALHRTWAQLDMVYFRAITEATEVHKLIAELAEQSAAWWYLNRFTDRYCWVPWRSGLTASYARTFRPDDMVTTGYLDIQTTGAAATVPSVRITHLYDAARKQMTSDAACGPATSRSGYDLLEMRHEHMTVIPGVNDKLDFQPSGLGALTATLAAGDFDGPGMMENVRTAMLAVTNIANSRPQCAWGPYIIANVNNKLDFNDGSNRVATITAGAYASFEALCAEIQTQMNAVSSGWTVQFLRATRKVRFDRSAGTAQLLCLTGANIATSIWTTLGFYSNSNKTGATTYTADYEREEERFSIGVVDGLNAAATATLDLLWQTGTNGMDGTRISCRELLGFLGFRNQTGGQSSFMGVCPKNNREQKCRTSADRYGSKRAPVIEGTWIRDSATAREAVSRIIDLGVEPRLVVRFETLRAPDLERGRVVAFTSEFDRYIAYPKYGSDGSWAGKTFVVVDVRQNCGPERWDAEVTCVEVT